MFKVKANKGQITVFLTPSAGVQRFRSAGGTGWCWTIFWGNTIRYQAYSFIGLIGRVIAVHRWELVMFPALVGILYVLLKTHG